MAALGAWTLERYGMQGELCRVYDAARKELSNGYTTELVRLVDAHNASVAAASEPIPMILHCPACGQQHVDAPDERKAPAFGPGMDVEPWTNPPHRSHLCHGCGHIWRPADVPTVGVKALQTRGKNDSPTNPTE